MTRKQYRAEDLFLRFDALNKPTIHTTIGDRKTIAIPLSDHDAAKLLELVATCRAADKARRRYE